MSLLTKFRRTGVASLALGVALGAQAQAASAMGGGAGAIRIWGHGHKGEDYILTLLRAWEDGFRKTHPEVRFDDELNGNASAIGGLFTGAADLAILDREASFIEVDAYQQGAGYDPFRIAVARGSVGTTHHAPAPAIYVNEANPLSQLSVQQLDGIFDADHRLGTQSYRTWGDLGLTGAWAAKPIQLYMPEIQSAEVQFFERAALQGSQKFSCCMKLFEGKDGATAEARIEAALAKDKYGLALVAGGAAGVKAVALAGAEGKAVLPSPETITAGSYPLARTVYVYANRKPKAATPENVAEFLAYIVSAEGQAIVARTGGYLPLSPELAAKSREALK